MTASIYSKVTVCLVSFPVCGGCGVVGVVMAGVAMAGGGLSPDQLRGAGEENKCDDTTGAS